MRILLLAFLALIATEQVVKACCLGCACTKYKDREPIDVVQETVLGYTHSVAAGLPRWSQARIAKFLATGTWKPITTSSVPSNEPRAVTPLNVRVVPATGIQFVPADKIGRATAARAVLVRRIEKHGSAILVEVDDRTFKLAPCPRKKQFACLLDPGELTLDPIPPPGM